MYFWKHSIHTEWPKIKRMCRARVDHTHGLLNFACRQSTNCNRLGMLMLHVSRAISQLGDSWSQSTGTFQGPLPRLYPPPAVSPSALLTLPSSHQPLSGRVAAERCPLCMMYRTCIGLQSIGARSSSGSSSTSGGYSPDNVEHCAVGRFVVACMYCGKILG